MLSLRSDFLLAYGDFDYGGEHQGAEGLATLDELTTAGVQVYTVVCPDEAGDYTNENFDAVYRTILDLGKIFGVSERAERCVAEMQAQIAEVSQQVRGRPVVKVIAYYSGQVPLYVNGGRATLIKQIIEIAGGENVFAEPNEYTIEVSLETVAAKEADAFLIFANSEEPTDTPDGTKEAQFLFDTFRTCRPARTAGSSSPTIRIRHPAGASRRRSRTSPGSYIPRRSGRWPPPHSWVERGRESRPHLRTGVRSGCRAVASRCWWPGSARRCC